MSFHVVDLSRDPRRAQFDYFQSPANPYVGVTVPAVEYDRCPTSHTVALPDGSDCYCRLDAVLPGAGTGTCGHRRRM